jgi:hypothetical protein
LAPPWRTPSKVTRAARSPKADPKTNGRYAKGGGKLKQGCDARAPFSAGFFRSESRCPPSAQPLRFARGWAPFPSRGEGKRSGSARRFAAAKKCSCLPPLRGKVAAELRSSEGGRKGGPIDLNRWRFLAFRRPFRRFGRTRCCRF